jgi:diguanylate cyclase (GGDEF)-like protein
MAIGTNSEFLEKLSEMIDKLTPVELAEFRRDVRKAQNLPEQPEPLLEAASEGLISSMEKPNATTHGKEIVAGNNRAIAQRSSALVSRGLHDLSTRDVAAYVELGKALTSSLQRDQVLRVVMEKMEEFLRPQAWYLTLLDEAKEELYFEIVVGNDSQRLKDLRVKLGQGISGWVAKNGEAVVATDVRKDPRFLQEVDAWPETETRSIVAVPLQVQGRCMGVIGLVNNIGPEGLSQSDLSLLQALADFAAIALENARHVSAIHKLTITDERTGLYNARHLGFILDTEIWRSERYGYNFSLLRVELPKCKDLTKSLSYAQFNQLLNELGQFFKNLLRLIDCGFYLGDEQFMILLPQTTKESGRIVAQRIHKLFGEALWLRAEVQNLRIPAEVASAAFPEDGKTKAHLLHALDETSRG